MKYYASATLLTGLGPPGPVGVGVRLGIEGDWLPYLSEAQRTVGFEGTKVEDLNKVPVLARPRLDIGLPGQFYINLAYLPPIPINGQQANLFSFAFGRAFIPMPDLTVGVTAYGQIGNISGDITCPVAAARAGDDPALNPFGCEHASHDVTRLDYGGVQATVAYRIEPAFGLTPYAAVYATYMNLGFSVNAQYSGITDTTSLRTQGGTFAATTGLRIPVWTRIDLTGELFYSPLTVLRPPSTSQNVEGLFNVRALLSFKLI